MAKFTLNDESTTNSHGFVMLNSGAKLDRYRANPIMLFDHNSANIIGRMKDVHVEGSKLVAETEFDEKDDLGAKCKRQVDEDFLKGCSPGIIINAVEIRTLPDGTEQLTVTDWELCEVSLVSVPSNRNALRLYNSEMQPLFNDAIELSIKTLLQKKDSPKEENMDKIILTAEAYIALGLDSTKADGKAISAAIMALQARAENAEKKVNEQLKLQAKTLVDDAIKQGKITADLRQQYETLATENFELAQKTLAGIPAREKLAPQIHNSGKITIDESRKDWSYLQWSKQDPEGLKKMKAEEPERFAELQKTWK